MLGGLEIHPAIVHFPIALTAVAALSAIVYMLFRVEWIRWFAPVLLSLALLGAVGAYFSGESAKDRAETLGVPEAAIEKHEETGIWGLGTTGLACLLTWATHTRRRGVFLSTALTLAAAGIFLWNGHLGGQLVFIHGAGKVSAPVAPRAAAHPGTAQPRAPHPRKKR
ncbi:MAG: hypothetical protein E6K79_04410 [Candidatus Eisenbacteria bacterium]|uniref:DUF2231 domain-containing protein n=1 Tax=Eiseniibacteriota bacterium TaxID=2212470 RepID=A0A538TPP3_UNCEI|nr:MAG: hypothetical protein E6K79_04410 [Candidatus Eisenbacteria bacterium]